MNSRWLLVVIWTPFLTNQSARLPSGVQWHRPGLWSRAIVIRISLVSSCLVFSLATLSVAADRPAVDFAGQVRPILQARCLKCHGPDKQEGGLRLDRRE